VKDRENLKRIASWFIDDEIGENPVEKHLPAREVGAAVAAVWEFGQLVKAFENLGDDPISLRDPVLREDVKPMASISRTASSVS